MKRLNLILAIALSVTFILIAGCFPLSLNPFYTEKDVIFNPDFLGVWNNNRTGQTWEFTSVNRNNYYVEGASGGSDHFIAHLFKIQDTLYLDVYPEGGFANNLMIPTHMIVRVKKTESTLVTSYLNTRWLLQYLKDNPGGISYAFVPDENEPDDISLGLLVLTSSTGDLQRLLIEIQNTEEAFYEPEKLNLEPEK